MAQHIKIFTTFDITNTGVVRNLKAGMLPTTVNGVKITSEDEWLKARRQQSNWETMLQIIALRTQPFNVRTIHNDGVWMLEFDVEHSDVYRKEDDPIGLLKDDFNNVPLLVNLDESKSPGTAVSESNMRFEVYEL